jgi:hypothetical protein
VNWKEIGTIAGLVVATSAVFTVLFFTGFPAIAVFFGLLGVPAIFLGYTWQRVQESQDSMAALDDIQASELERLLARLKDLWNQTLRMQERYLWPVEDVEADVERFADELEPHASVRIENDQLFHELSDEGSPEVTWIEERKRSLDELQRDLAGAFADHMATWCGDLADEIEGLQAAGGLSSTPSPHEPPTEAATLAVVEDRYEPFLDDAETTIRAVHEDIGETLKSVETEQGIDVAPIWESHEMVQDALDRRDLPFAASMTSKVLEEMDDHLEGEFTDERTTLANGVEQVHDLKLNDLVDHETWRKVTDIRERVGELESSAQLLEVGDLEEQLRSALREIQEDVIDELERSTTKQRGRDLPDELVDDRDHEDLVDSLPNLHDDLGRVIPGWTSAIDELASIARDRSKLAEALDLYPRVAEGIEDALADGGQVTAKDLKVKDPEPFFRIYEAKHPDACRFDEDAGVLRAEGAT